MGQHHGAARPHALDECPQVRRLIAPGLIRQPKGNVVKGHGDGDVPQIGLFRQAPLATQGIKDGGYRSLSWTLMPVGDRAQAVARDLTERRSVEEQLRLASTVFETAGEAIIVTDANQRIQKVNHAFTIITGFSASVTMLMICLALIATALPETLPEGGRLRLGGFALAGRYLYILRERGFLDIAPNSLAFTEGFTVLKENTIITNFQPHFHLRGKAMQVEAILPDGSRQIVSYVGNFNFNWMTNYIYADDAAPVFPKGTVIHVSAWYDNTKNNPTNPDPEQWVGYGDRTVDEMAHAWMNVVYLDDAEYKALLAERKAKATNEREREQREDVARCFIEHRLAIGTRHVEELRTNDRCQ